MCESRSSMSSLASSRARRVVMAFTEATSSSSSSMMSSAVGCWVGYRDSASASMFSLPGIQVTV